MSRTSLEALNAANPNQLASLCQAVRLGDALGAAPMVVRGVVASHVLVLPERFRAAAILAAFATAGTVAGQKTPVPMATAPATTQVGITATGNVLFNAGTDVVTEAEVIYVPFQGQVIEEVITVAASLGTLNQSRKAALLLEATVVTGVTPGLALTVDYRNAAIASGEAGINLLGSGITFNAANVVAGTVRVKYIAQLGVGYGVPLPLVNRLNDQQSAF